MGVSVRSWPRRHPRLVDGAIAGAICVYNLPLLAGWVPGTATFWAGLALSLGLCLPQLLRRRRPVTALTLTVVAAAVTGVVSPPVPAYLMLLLRLHDVAAHRSRRLSLAAAGVLGLGAVLSAWRWEDSWQAGLSRLVVAGVLIVSVWLWGHTLALRRVYVAGLQERAEQLVRERDAQARVAAAGERARIARELHDVVSHSLSVMVVLADGAQRTLRRDPDRAERTLGTLAGAGRRTMTDMRRMLDVLHSDDPPGPPPSERDLGTLVAQARDTGAPVELRELGRPRRLPADTGLAVYRVVQESLTNVRKHAGPGVGEVLVQLEWAPEHLDVTVTDDGPGTAATTPPAPVSPVAISALHHPVHDSDREGRRPAPGGHGLAGMRERVVACGGRLRAGPGADGGFGVRVRIPAAGPPGGVDQPGPGP